MMIYSDVNRSYERHTIENRTSVSSSLFRTQNVIHIDSFSDPKKIATIFCFKFDTLSLVSATKYFQLQNIFN